MTNHDRNPDARPLVKQLTALEKSVKGVLDEPLDKFEARIDGMEQWDVERELGQLIDQLHTARCKANCLEKSARAWREEEAERLEEIRICRRLLGLEHRPIGPWQGDAAPASDTDHVPEGRGYTPEQHR